jgi:hypothetical protein
MGGSEHSQNEFAHKNNAMNANDQYKQGPETDIGTDNPKRPELEGTDGGNVGTDVISPPEGAFVVGQLYSVQYKSIFGTPKKVRRYTRDKARLLSQV